MESSKTKKKLILNKMFSVEFKVRFWIVLKIKLVAIL